jgi:acid phosphatase type 7
VNPARRLLAVLVLLCLACVGGATEASAQTLTRGPLIQNPDALTTRMTIVWWTNVAGDSTVQYGLTPGLGSSQTVGQAASCEIGAAGTCHEVTLTGLTPGTRYYYRLLTNGVEVLGVNYFQTFKASNDTSELFFTVVGDFGQGTSGQANVANNQNSADTPLIVTVGDNAYQNGTQSDWDNNVFIP